MTFFLRDFTQSLDLGKILGKYARDLLTKFVGDKLSDKRMEAAAGGKWHLRNKCKVWGNLEEQKMGSLAALVI